MEEFESCESTIIHADVVDGVCAQMPDDDILIDLADAFKVFGDFTRLKILSALLGAEMCVCDISYLLGMTKSAVSHQLRLLRQNDLIRSRKDGRMVYYSIADEHVATIIRAGMEHVVEPR